MAEVFPWELSGWRIFYTNFEKLAFLPLVVGSIWQMDLEKLSERTQTK
jgi:hypothetical protein